MAGSNFRSDNEAGAAPEIIQALVSANRGSAHAYGEDALTQRVCERFEALFETKLAVFPVSTGTAANALAISQMCPPYGAVFCHTEAHINTDECGAPEFYSGGAKLIGLDGAHGKIVADDFADRLAGAGRLGDHESKPCGVSLSQATERGTLYDLAELADLTQVAHAHGLSVHMDGARFANALVSMGCTPADMTWRAGVDLLSFGATKNGALAAEALLVFREDLAEALGRRRKRAGHLLSKMRFLSAQLDAYLEDGLWLALAERANQAAAVLGEGLDANPAVRLAHPVQANEVFVTMPEPLVRRLRGHGFEFHDWPSTPGLYRLVCSFDTTFADVRALIAAAAENGADKKRAGE